MIIYISLIIYFFCPCGFFFPDKRHRDDPQLQCEQFVFWDLVPQEKKRGHLHPEGLQHGGEESLDHRPGEDSMGSGRSQ